MKTKIRLFLKIIDTLLEAKEPKERYMLYVLIIGGIAFSSYYFLWDISKEYKDSIVNESGKMGSRIMGDKIYLTSNPEIVIQKLNTNIIKIEDEYSEYNEANEYIKFKISQISYLFYNERIWGKFLNSISLNAQTYNIKMLKFENNLVLGTDAFGHLLDIHIKTEGGFRNTLKFINSLEKSTLVVDIQEINFSVEDNLIISELKLSVWGISQ
jgi:hypothetical protein